MWYKRHGTCLPAQICDIRLYPMYRVGSYLTAKIYVGAEGISYRSGLLLLTALDKKAYLSALVYVREGSRGYCVECFRDRSHYFQ